MPNVDLSERIKKAISYQVRQMFVAFWNLIGLTLSEKLVKGLASTKVVKEIKFERAWDELEPKSFISFRIV